MGVLDAHRRVQTSLGDVPVIVKLWLLFLGPLAVLLCVSVDDAVHKQGERADRDSLKLAPEYVARFEHLVAALTEEQEEVLRFFSVQRNLTRLKETQREVDAAVDAVNSVVYRAADKGIEIEAFSASFDLRLLVHVRHLVERGNVAPAFIFAEYSRLLSNSLPAVFASFDSSSKGATLAAHLAMSFANAYLKLEQAAAGSTSLTPTSPSLRLQLVKLQAAREVYVELVRGSLLQRPWASQMLTVVQGDKNWRSGPGERAQKDPPPVRMSLTEEEREVQENAKLHLAAAASALYTETQERIQESKDIVSVHLSLDVSCIVVAALFMFVQVGIIAIRRSNREYEENKHRELMIMVDTVDRIAEYSSHFALFDLRVPLLPVGKMLTHLELTLMKCMSALKIVAPALPPELFPERFVIKPQERNIAQRDMCDMEVMMNQIPPHHPPQTTDTKATPREANTAKALALMTKRCRLGLRKVEGSFLTVSFTWIHDRIEANNGEQPKYMTPYISLIEAVTVRHQGLVHKLFGDRMICSWNVASPVEQHSHQACHAGLALLPESELLYNSKEIYVASAVTFGEVVAGNIGFTPPSLRPGIDGKVPQHGSVLEQPHHVQQLTAAAQSIGAAEPKAESDGFRTYSIFGPPIELGGRVAFYQHFYNTATAVLCDHETAQRVRKQLAVKPLEPIMRSDTSSEVVSIYSILGVSQGRQSEQLEALDLFNAAYDLFAQRKFLEAEKAFCHYTKVYGYDNVVERLQKLISHGKTVDDMHAHDITHLQ